MKTLAGIPYAAVAGLLSLTVPVPLTSDLPRLLASAGLLGSFTVLVYRLGVWRQEMENTKSNVGAEVRSYREETSANFARIERRLEALDHVIAKYMQQASKKHLRMTHRLGKLEEKTK